MVERLSLIPRCFVRDFQKLEVNNDPQSETMSAGVPCFEITQVMRWSARLSVVSVAMVGMKRPIFVN